MNTIPFTAKRATIAAAALTCLMLAGCSGTGSLAVTDGRGTSGVTGAVDNTITGGINPALRAFSNVVDNGGGLLGSTSDVVSTLGTVLASWSMPGTDAGITGGLGGVLQSTANAIDTLGIGLSEGLGALDTNIANPVGVTLASVPGVVDHLGTAVVSAGGTVAAVGASGALSVLEPVTTPVGGLVTQVGGGVNNLATTLATNMDATVIQRVGSGVTTLIMPVADTTLSLTQAVGASTGLGKPVDNLLIRVGTGVDGIGDSVTATNVPVLLEAGQVVSGVGGAVAILGGAVNAPEGTPAPAGLNGVLAPVTTALGGITGGATGGDTGGLLAPVTTLVGGLTGGLNGGTGGTGGALAPVTTAVSGLTGGLSGGLGGGTGGPLAPVTGVVSTVVGGVTSGTTGGGTTGGATTPLSGLLAGVGGLLR